MDEESSSPEQEEPSQIEGSRDAGWPSRFLGSLQSLENAITREHAGYKKALRVGVVVSILVHVVALVFILPHLTGRVTLTVHPEIELVVLPPAEDAFAIVPPAVEVPAPPSPVLRPAIPRPASIETPDWVPPFIPHDTPPRLINTEQVIQILQERYPVELRSEGVEGAVLLWVFVNEGGVPTKLQLRRSSGYDGLDQAAQSVGQEMRFRPAMNQDQPVGVWVAQQIRFELRFDPAEEESSTSASDSTAGSGV
jgi:TonB family protein